MDVDESLVRHVARLARLALTDEEVAAMAPQLARILHHVEAVRSEDVRGVEPAAAAPVDLTALREDVVAPGLAQEEALRAAPAHDEAFFLVPRVLAE